MIQEEKQLLLKDLCGRLPYGVLCKLDEADDRPRKLLAMGTEYAYVSHSPEPERIEDLKPYLRPMSSMTEEELIELNKIDTIRLVYSSRHLTYHLDAEIVDCLVAHHFDFRGLIPMGLALEAPADMYKTK